MGTERIVRILTITVVALSLTLVGLSTNIQAQETSASSDAGCLDGSIRLTVLDEGVRLQWPEQAAVIVHDVLRREGTSGTFEPIGQAPNFRSEFLDTAVEPGKTYQYKVEVKFDTSGPGSATTSFCHMPTGTAVPVFPGLATGTLAAVAGLGMYVGLRRRR